MIELAETSVRFSLVDRITGVTVWCDVDTAGVVVEIRAVIGSVEWNLYVSNQRTVLYLLHHVQVVVCQVQVDVIDFSYRADFGLYLAARRFASLCVATGTSTALLNRINTIKTKSYRLNDLSRKKVYRIGERINSIRFKADHLGISRRVKWTSSSTSIVISSWFNCRPIGVIVIRAVNNLLVRERGGVCQVVLECIHALNGSSCRKSKASSA